MTLELSYPPLARADAWLKNHRRFVWISIVVIGCLLRGIAFAELGNGPMGVAHRHSQMDMRFFHEWAKEISEKDVLGREPKHPNHHWHTLVAVEYYKKHPELLASPVDEMSKEEQADLSRKLWADWYGGNRFHQEPLYAYFLAAVFAIQGSDDVRAVLALQLLGGVLTGLLLYFATRRMFGDLVAVATALVALVWAPLIHYELTLLRTSFLSLAGIGMLFTMQGMLLHRESSGPRQLLRLFGFGCVIGLATALKSTFLLIGLGLVVVLFWPARKQIRTLAVQGGMIAGGVLLFLIPIWIRNAVVGAPLFSMTSVGPVTVAGVNVPGTVPSFGWFPFPQAESIAGVMERGGQSVLSAMTESIALHESLWSFLELPWGKLMMVWHWFEIPNNTNVHTTYAFSTLLDTLQYLASAAWIMPAALIGFILALRQRRPVGIWLWYVACCLVPLVVLYTLSRFRAPMVIAMIPFALFAIIQVVDTGVTRRTWRAPLIGLAFAGMVAFMCRPILPPRPLVSAGNYILPIKHYFMPRVEAARAEGDHARAVQILEELIERRPGFLDEVGPRRALKTDNELMIAREVFGTAYGMAYMDAKEGKLPKESFYKGHAERLLKATREFISLHGDPSTRVK